MNKIQNKTMATLIAFLLMSTITASTMTCLPIANALTHTESGTNAFITVSPNPIGVGQSMYVMYWLVQTRPGSGANQDVVWNDFTLKITKPDGKTETIVKAPNSAVVPNPYIYS